MMKGLSPSPAIGRSLEWPSGAVATLAGMTQEMPGFQAYVGEGVPRFVNDAERECAKILDYHGVPWEYEPRTFVLERDEHGRVV